MKLNSLIFLSLLFLTTCKVDEAEIILDNSIGYQTKNIIIVSIDGPRYVDTWKNTSEDIIPGQRLLKTEGVFFSNFYNNGSTYTLPGHSAITTGSYESIHNDGSEYPSHGSIFQLYLSSTLLSPFKSCLIAGKNKMEALGNSKDFKWRNSFQPYVNTEDREDSITLKMAKKILTQHHPNLSMIHFKGPDDAGHANDWKKYIESIKETDQYVSDLWNFIQSDEYYKDQTALLITNDHGRHLDGIRDGFVSHGDRCDGCRHISLLALGPDFNKGVTITKDYEQVDIAPTVARLLNFPWKGEGKEIKQLTQ